MDAWLTRLQVWAIDEEQARITARLGPDAPPLAPEESDALLKRKQALREERASLSTHYGRVGARPSS